MANAKNGETKRFTKENFVRAFNRENIAKAAFIALAAFSILAVIAIVFFILYSSIPAFQETNFFKFLFGSVWEPSSGVYGILPMIVTSIVLTFFSVLIGGTLAVFTAIFVAFYCPRRIKKIYSQIINLLAGIPSIIFGYFGLQLVKPLLQDIFGVVSASGIFLSTIILSIMILPTIASMVKNSLDNVPKEYFEGSLALGNTKNQTVFRVILPAAKKGIIAAMILGIGRAVGETMAVQLLLGGKVNYPTSLFIGVRSMTSNIVTEFGYATGTWRSSLIATGLILLIFILLINILLWFVKGNKGVAGNSLFKKNIKEADGEAAKPASSYYTKGLFSNILMVVSYLVAILVAAALIFIVLYVFVEGVPYLTFDFVFGESSYGNVTMAPAFVNTVLIILVALVVALPLGIGAAIYLNEYAKRGGKFVQTVRLFIDTLAGVPSIIFGIFGAILFGQYCNMNYSLWAGGLTMALMILPTIIRSTEQNLSEIPDSMREASYALGAGKVRTVFVVILPQALAGIITGIILAIGRIIGETAALIYTAGMGIHMPTDGLSSPGATLAVLIYYMYSEGLQTGEAFAVATMLIIFVFILNLLVSFVEYAFHNKISNQKGYIGRLIEKIKNRNTKKEVTSYDDN